MPGEEFPHYIEFRNVSKAFSRPVLQNVNFYLDAGQTLAIIGRSGVGKSVTLSHIMGFLKPDSGQVIVAHTDITHMSEPELREIRRKVTMVFQSGALFDSLTVGENIEFPMEIWDGKNQKREGAIVDDLLKKVDLTDLQNAYPADLATGYKRAVAIARALAAQPECILYDEPTTMVDPIMSDHIGNLMLRLKRRMKLTAVVVTHDLDLMRKVADTVMFLYKGEAIYFGPVSKLETCNHPHVKQFIAMDRVEIAGKIEET
ncbi:MAG: ATP-binding cassette domain-containing protein [Acidobacteriaceae bacterium]|nr:ATP-binding cassette domain-containing protein [Acidobacteriaceae bacterium]